MIFVSPNKKVDGYEGTLQNGEKLYLSIEETAELISDNTFKKRRAVFLGSQNFNAQKQSKRIKFDGFFGVFVTSEGIRLSVLPHKKEILILQGNVEDWALISGADLTGWSVNFTGIPLGQKTAAIGEQRFNSNGITGCLTIYDSHLDDTTVKVRAGGCEDSLNIISSDGHIKKLTIENAFADALDMDFSTITISDALVFNSGNDCYDVSGGEYLIEDARFEACGDKSISVGESSVLSVQNIKVIEAGIGISSKDYSTVYIDSATLENVDTCVEAKQKKQEFGGAFISAKNLKCDGEIEIDLNSTLELAGQ